LEKTRLNVIHYYDIISDVSVKSIIISADDISFNTITRSDIIPINIPTKIKETKTIRSPS
jgi:hypothetical protein